MTAGIEDRETVRAERVDGVGRVVLNRPRAHNTLTETLITDLRDVVVELASDGDLRALVITGAGPAFCAGADLNELHGDDRDAQAIRTLASRLHTAVRHLATAPVPVVAGVNGVVAGGGLGLALAADVVLVDEGAKFRFSYPAIGLSGDGGSTWFLPRILGHRRAREFCLLNERVPADEAVELGLGTRVVAHDDFEDELAAVATDLADGPTAAYGEIKRLLTRSQNRDLTAHLADEADTLARMAETEDYERGVAAFLGDEEAEFVGR